MDLTARPFRPEDEERIRRLLRDLLVADPGHPRCWPVPRWDYWVTHGLHNCEWQILEDVVVVWEASDRSVAAVANPEGSGQAFFQAHPERRSAELDRAMLDEMERRMAAADGDRRRLTVWVPADDDAYRHLLAGAGYSLTDGVDVRRVRRLDQPVSDAARGWVSHPFARAGCLAEGLRRARALGATLASVGSWNEATHELYGAAGFEAAVRMAGWRKCWP